MDLHAIRQDYSKQELSEAQCLADPIEQFELWLNEAMAAQVNEPTAMNVATVGADNRPTNRVVLLKEVNPQGFVFFTNYASRKGQALAQHPFAALTFFWPELERQVRIEGQVFRLPEHESDAYFASRPYTNRVGAWASEQSQPIANKAVLVAMWCSPTAWNFGRGGPAVCTTACVMCWRMARGKKCGLRRSFQAALIGKLIGSLKMA